ncbi:MAG: VWA domain-containing protein, partial [Actinobacteria bacterium]|nr:VWA domain-containing protein [Actinomycetota bacterium]
MSQGPNPPYPAVLNAFQSLVDSIPEGDNLSVLTFDSSPNLAFQGEITSGTREQAKASLPPEAMGRATDIGSAIDATLRRLERADASDVQMVMFLTDGQHQPAAGSAYPGTNGPEWDALRARAQAVDAGHDTLVLGVGLGDQGAGGIELLRQVFGSPEINSLPPEQLPD